MGKATAAGAFHACHTGMVLVLVMLDLMLFTDCIYVALVMGHS